MNKNYFFSVPHPPHLLRSFLLAFLLFTLTLFICAGCDFRRVVVNQRADPKVLETLNSGESSLQEVVQVLGAPDAITPSPDGMVFLYRYGDTKTLRVNFGWVLRFFLPVAPSMNLGRGEGAPHVLHIVMNQDGVFDQYLFQQSLDPPQFSFWPF